jgi:hypothetical protein
MSRFSVKNESESDSLAFLWMTKAGYNYEGLTRSNTYSWLLNQNYLLHYENEPENKFPTHPEPLSRKLKLETMALKLKPSSGAEFLVDETLLKSTKSALRVEVLKLLLNNFRYKSCMEMAFKYHLYEPTNRAYVYYLMESIRRHCYLDKSNWKNNFITHYYFEEYDFNSIVRRKPITYGILEKFPFEMLCLDSSAEHTLPGRFYWEQEKKFATNEEAFVYFYKVGKKLNEPECILSNALSLYSSKETRNKLLSTYLSYPEIMHREYASSLLSDSIYQQFPSKELLIVSDYYARVHQKKETIYLRNRNTGELNMLDNVQDTLFTRISDKNLMSLQDLRQFRINDYHNLRQLETFSFQTILSRGSSIRLHVLDPRYWNTMRKFGTNHFVFINMVFGDQRGPEHSIESYQNILNCPLDSLYISSTPNRTFNVTLTSIRDTEDGVMKARAFNSGSFKKSEYTLSRMTGILDAALKEYYQELHTKIYNFGTKN